MNNNITPVTIGHFAVKRHIRAKTGLVAVFLASLGLSNGPAFAIDKPQTAPPAPFRDLTLTDWEERSFSGNSRYELVDVDGIRILRGTTDGAASILYKEKTINLKDTPLISWSWKIKNIYDDINEKTRDGDDFPARLYVVVKTGFLPWETLAINYIWSSHQKIAESWSNPFTNKAKMVVVQTGNSKAGEWVTQTRNIASDFKELFGKEIKKIDGYAVMIDGDNSNQKGTAWFADINFQNE